ncbi:hypothetical protein CXB51_013955 [Gossypium anomalum]|uniref:Uncharacterized protein n=1 Tax=Gossypium anomalum TaxID=47600 RepID=A0A8J6CZZ2_9ROSI|nr:hypothetical protein CXB51_013955 [Gossypium anomalum]
MGKAMPFSTMSLIRLLQKIVTRKSESNHSPCSYVFGINFIPDMSACFSWPNLQIQTKKLRKKIMKKGGLFFIPLQSNVTGSRYSYTWMSLAQENGWHVLLDAPLHEIEEIIDSSTSNTLQCKALDHAYSLGLVLISSRAKSLINWVVNALMSLQHPHSKIGIPIVKIYGPKLMFDRVPVVALNVFDWKAERIDPALVQKLTNRNNISFCIGLDVVTVAIGFLTSFEHIYRIWVFVSRFLDANFLEKEKWRYKALNQKTIGI